MRLKKQLLAIGILLAFLLIPSGAFAGGGIAIQLNGSDMSFTDAAPINQNGRVYVPFRVVFEGMDANVDYAKATRTITAKKGNTVVQFTVGNANIKVNGQVVKTDAPSFIRNSRTYVPVRFAAQSLRIQVGWDQKAQTVVMVDKALWESKIPSDYKTMDGLMEFFREQKAQNLEVNGNMNLDMKLVVEGKKGVKQAPVTGSFDVTGSTKGNLSNLDIKGSMDMDAYQKALKEAGKLRDEDVNTAKVMKNFQMKVIENLDRDKVYLKSPVFALSDLNPNVWYQMDQGEAAMEEGFGMSALMKAADYDSFEAFVRSELNNLQLEDANYCKGFLNAVEGYRDSRFTDKDGNKRAVITKDDDETVILTLKTAGDRVAGYEEQTITYMKGMPVSTVTVSGDASAESVNMTMNVAGMMSVNFSSNLNYTEGKTAPMALPPSGEKVVVLK